VYVDGFNLYYGLLKGTRYKWLDLEKCFTSIRQDDQIQQIKYFTAKVKGTDSLIRQQTYLNALSTSSLVQIIYGLFKEKVLKCGVTYCSHTSSKNYSRYEEKRTDVNIAVSMLDDAYKRNCERIILVSGDSDLVPAVNLIRKNFPSIQVILYVPAVNNNRGAARELRNAAHKDKTLNQSVINVSQFPDSVISSSGVVFNKPDTW
jgi:uncharacterized LabA/DUF88 family protein